MKRKIVIIASIVSALVILIGLVGALSFDQYLTAIPYLYFGITGLIVSTLYNLLRFIRPLAQKIGFFAITFLTLIFLIGWFYTPLLKDNGVYYLLMLIGLVWWLILEVFVLTQTFYKKYLPLSIGFLCLCAGVFQGLDWFFYLTFIALGVDLVLILIRVNTHPTQK
ncbi:MAG: hypothetical protein N4A41_14200 [Crocinitomicaceae bacterium]|nr:hypothetical protein [Crocinitomicaceae bacterium]